MRRSPYRNPVVGWMSDISRVTKQEMIDYREQYYRPDNATLVLVGDVDEKIVMPLVTKYFGPLKSKGPSPRVRTEEPYAGVLPAGPYGPNFKTPYIEKRVIGRAATNPPSRSCSTSRRSGTTTRPRSTCSGGR